MCELADSSVTSKSCVMIDAREKLLGPQREEVDVTSLDRHTTAHDRIEPIVGATGEADLKLGHLVSLRHLSCIVVSHEYHCKFRVPTIGIHATRV